MHGFLEYEEARRHRMQKGRCRDHVNEEGGMVMRRRSRQSALHEGRAAGFERTGADEVECVRGMLWLCTIMYL